MSTCRPAGALEVGVSRGYRHTVPLGLKNGRQTRFYTDVARVGTIGVNVL